jgi:hypothetical protein
LELRRVFTSGATAPSIELCKDIVAWQVFARILTLLEDGIDEDCEGDENYDYDDNLPRALEILPYAREACKAYDDYNGRGRA